jgi:carboxyl-terminal processing protease
MQSQPPQPGFSERLARTAVPVFLLLAIVTLAFGLGYVVNALADDDEPQVAGAGPGDNSNNGASGDAIGAAILDEIYELLANQYVDPILVNEDNFLQSAIDGIIASLNDPHTDYLTPDEVASGALDLGSTYEGIGASVSDRTGQVTIVAPFRDSPAEVAGIQAGDIILAVDGVSTEGWSDQQAVQVIRGPRGTPVTLTVLHADGTQEDITITRGDIDIQSVFTEPLLEVIPGESEDRLVDREGNEVTDIAYVYIGQFHDQTLEELRTALADVENGDYIGLVVDVRLNPGGLLSATVNVADEFLDSGTILIEEDREKQQRPFTATPGGVATNIPIVILQDGGSASGSEVLSAALRDNARATVVGTRSFGKGTVNQLQELDNCGDPDGCGALYISVGRWLTPLGDRIEGIGVPVDAEVEMTGDDYIDNGDIQLFRAIDILRGE